MRGKLDTALIKFISSELLELMGNYSLELRLDPHLKRQDCFSSENLIYVNTFCVTRVNTDTFLHGFPLTSTVFIDEVCLQM